MNSPEILFFSTNPTSHVKANDASISMHIPYTQAPSLPSEQSNDTIPLQLQLFVGGLSLIGLYFIYHIVDSSK